MTNKTRIQNKKAGNITAVIVWFSILSSFMIWGLTHRIIAVAVNLILVFLCLGALQAELYSVIKRASEQPDIRHDIINPVQDKIEKLAFLSIFYMSTYFVLIMFFYWGIKAYK